jgi:hypothetical protein
MPSTTLFVVWVGEKKTSFTELIFIIVLRIPVLPHAAPTATASDLDVSVNSMAATRFDLLSADVGGEYRFIPHSKVFRISQRT